jgi:hypothetical protein
MKWSVVAALCLQAGCASSPLCPGTTLPLELRARAPVGAPGINRPIGTSRGQYVECVAVRESDGVAAVSGSTRPVEAVASPPR